MIVIDHVSIVAGGMKRIRLPRRKRGGQSAAAAVEFERALTEWCQEIIRVATRELCRQAILKYVSHSAIEKYRRRLTTKQRRVQRAVKRLLNGGRS